MCVLCTTESYLSEKSVDEFGDGSGNEENDDKAENNCALPPWL